MLPNVADVKQKKQKNTMELEQTTEKSILKVNLQLTKCPVLICYDLMKQIVVAVDASSYGLRYNHQNRRPKWK